MKVLVPMSFREPESDKDFEYIGRLMVIFGQREMHQQDARGWNRLYNKVMTSFTTWKNDDSEYHEWQRANEAPTVYSGDGHRPHKWPGNPADGDSECIAWKCAACGEWISEFKDDRTDCPRDWRAESDVLRKMKIKSKDNSNDS